MSTAVAFAISVLSELPSLITAGIDVVNLVKSTNATLKAAQAAGRDPTALEWEQLDKTIEDLRAQLPAV